jgi:hypothetical protein
LNQSWISPVGPFRCFAEFEVHDLAVGLLIVGAPLLVAPEEADQIGVLFDRT